MTSAATKQRKPCAKDIKKKCKAAEDSKVTAVQNAKNLFGFSETQCHSCGISNDDIGGFLLQCNTCKKAYYCGMACFNANLPFHQQFCNTNQLEREPNGRKEIFPKQPEEHVKPTKKAPSVADDFKQKKTKATSKQKKPEATPRKQDKVRKTFVDSSCSESADYETETESESETKADPSTSATGSGVNHGDSVNDSTIQQDTETLDPVPAVRVSAEPASKRLVLDELFVPDSTMSVQKEQVMEPVEDE
jgi:MYND finger